MGKRRVARECTLQILFQLEFNDSQLESSLSQYWENKRSAKDVKEYSTWLVKGIVSYKKQIDKIIQSTSHHWRVSRMSVVDLNVLRIAVFELFFEEDLAPAIVINEAIEIARKYSGDQAATFVNGILDAIRKGKSDIKKSLKEEKNG